MKLSIRYKLLLGFAVVPILLFIALFMGFAIIQEYLLSQTHRLQIEKAQLTANQIDSFFNKIELDNLDIAREFQESSPSSQFQVANIINYTLIQNRFIRSIAILTPTGQEIIKVDRFGQTPPQQLATEPLSPAFSSALEKRTGISKVYVSQQNAIPQMDIYTPILRDDSTLLGVVKNQIQLDRLWDLISQVKLGKAGFVYVADNEGHLIAHANIELVLKNTNVSNRSIVASLITSQDRKPNNTDLKTNDTYTNEKGVDVVANGVQLPQLNWAIVVEQPQSEAFNQLHLLKRLFYITLIGTLLTLSLMSWFLSRSFTHPIQSLKAVTDKLQQGDLTARASIKSGDELEDLGNSFNIMAAKLKDSFSQLEDKVKQLNDHKERLDTSAKLLLRRDMDLRRTNEEVQKEKEAIEGERNKLAIVLAGIHDGVIAVDRQLHIIIFNVAAEKITGVKVSEAIGKPIDQVIKLFDQNEEVIPSVYCPVKEKNLQDEIVFSKENLKLVAGTNRPAYVNVITGMIKEGSSINLGSIMTFHDVTHERELEQMKLDFVSMAVHELRTPLTTVQGYLSLMQVSPTLSKLDTQEQEFLNRASLSAVRLNKLIENLLVVSRIEQGEVYVQLKEGHLEPVVQKIFNEFKGLAQSKKLTLTYNPPTKDLSSVMIDTERIEEVISNLIGNAINYTQNGGVEVSIKEEEDSIAVSVKDTGQGIPEDAIPHLFTKFFRVQGKLESGSKGTGLGLYISKNIIDAHNGKIWVTSTLNVGSTFYFSLPVVKK